MITKTITTDLTTLLEEQLTNPAIDFISFGLTNQGSIAFNAFEVQFQIEKGGDWYTWFNQSSDWTSLDTTSAILTAVGDPTSLAAGAQAAFLMDKISGWYAVRLQASVASGTTTAKLEVGGE